jgi:hypothetical protein
MPRSIQARLDQSPEVISGADLIDKRDGKPKRVPKKIQRAITLIFTGKCRYAADAAKDVGLTPEHLSRMMRKPHVQVFIAQERARILSDGSMRAASRLVSLVDAESEHVSLQASQHVLAIQGIAPPSERHGVQVNVNVTPGYIVKLRHAPDAPVIDGEAISVDTAAIDNKGK